MSARFTPSRDYSASGLAPNQLLQLASLLELDPRVATVQIHSGSSGTPSFLRTIIQDEVPLEAIPALLEQYVSQFPGLHLDENKPLSSGPARPPFQ